MRPLHLLLFLGLLCPLSLVAQKTKVSTPQQFLSSIDSVTSCELTGSRWDFSGLPAGKVGAYVEVIQTPTQTIVEVRGVQSFAIKGHYRDTTALVGGNGKSVQFRFVDCGSISLNQLWVVAHPGEPKRPLDFPLFQVEGCRSLSASYVQVNGGQGPLVHMKGGEKVNIAWTDMWRLRGPLYRIEGVKDVTVERHDLTDCTSELPLVTVRNTNKLRMVFWDVLDSQRGIKGIVYASNCLESNVTHFDIERSEFTGTLGHFHACPKLDLVFWDVEHCNLQPGEPTRPAVFDIDSCVDADPTHMDIDSNVVGGVVVRFAQCPKTRTVFWKLRDNKLESRIKDQNGLPDPGKKPRYLVVLEGMKAKEFVISSWTVERNGGEAFANDLSSLDRWSSMGTFAGNDFPKP